MLELDNLLAKVELARRTRGQVNLTDRYLRCQTKMVGRRRAAGNNGLTAASLGFFDDFFDRRSSNPETAFDRTQIHPSPRAQELSSLGKTRKGLIDSSTLSKVQKRFGSNRRAFGQFFGDFQNPGAKGGHGSHSSVRNIGELLTPYKS
ncbi:hypothetical protein XI00_06460 [Bradyrhizobium sp. CCBAU 21359]|nr:hypothetical protein [Bradyrhizobium sp. CCBAU 21359]